jgi:hypothetical protein
MAKDKNKTVNISIKGTDPLQICTKQVIIRNYKAELGLIVEWVIK